MPIDDNDALRRVNQAQVEAEVERAVWKTEFNLRTAHNPLPPPSFPEPPAPGAKDTRPVYRKDGQVHNFALTASRELDEEDMNPRDPVCTDRKMSEGFSREDYERRYGGARPVPKFTVKQEEATAYEKRPPCAFEAQSHGQIHEPSSAVFEEELPYSIGFLSRVDKED